jgi:hypothetical protein
MGLNKRTILDKTARILASACAVGLLAGPACGSALAQEAPGATPVPPAPAAKSAKAPKANMRKQTPTGAPSIASLMEQEENGPQVQSSNNPGGSIKEIAPGPAKAGSSQSSPSRLSPEFRPAVEALTPSNSIAREPKTYDRLTPGISAVLYPGKDTEIQGVFNLPEQKVGSMRPYGQPEGGAKSAASGGVMLKKSF